MSEQTPKRPHLLGSTDAATILGYGRESQLALYLRLTGEPEPEVDSPMFFAGRAAEEAIFRPLIAKQLGVPESALSRIEPRALATDGRIGSSFDFIQFMPDGSIHIHECKLTGSSARWQEGDVPPEYYAQVKWQAMILSRPCDVRGKTVMPYNVSGATIWSLQVPGWKLTPHPIENPTEGATDLLCLAQEFLLRVENGNPPDPSTEDDARAAYAGTPGVAVRLDEVNTMQFERMATIKQQVKQLEQEEQAIRDSLIPAIGEATIVLAADGTQLATFKANREFDEQRFNELHPELAVAYQKATLDKARLKREHPAIYDRLCAVPTTPTEAKRVLRINY